MGLDTGQMTTEQMKKIIKFREGNMIELVEQIKTLEKEIETAMNSSLPSYASVKVSKEVWERLEKMKSMVVEIKVRIGL
jgi:hypothetical protein